jgi:tetratricopeptide (TPR) repeat protein
MKLFRLVTAGHRWRLAPPGPDLSKRTFVCALFVFTLVAGCAPSQRQASSHSPGMVTESLALLENELGAAESPDAVPNPRSFLELPTGIRQYLDREVVPLNTEEKRFNALRKWAFEEFSPAYEYDPSFTSPLQRLPDAGRINCFSFSNLFVAAARYADVPARFQLVESPPQWDINKDTWVVSQHINVTGSVYRKLSQRERQYLREQEQTTGTLIRRTPPTSMHRTYVVDLNPEIAVDAYRSRTISDREALSLFYSNRSVEELLSGRRDIALDYGRLAILSDRESATAWNNLGVLLSRQGKVQEARQAYLTAIALDPDGESAANNLERIYRRTGETDKADAMAARIRSNRMKNPYYHYALGEKMLALGDPKDAAKHFKAAISRKDDERLFYFGLAEAQIELGDYRRASKSLNAARKHSTPRDSERYKALNDRLSAVARDG